MTREEERVSRASTSGLLRESGRRVEQGNYAVAFRLALEALTKIKKLAEKETN